MFQIAFHLLTKNRRCYLQMISFTSRVVHLCHEYKSNVKMLRVYRCRCAISSRTGNCTFTSVHSRAFATALRSPFHSTTTTRTAVSPSSARAPNRVVRSPGSTARWTEPAHKSEYNQENFFCFFAKQAAEVLVRCSACISWVERKTNANALIPQHWALRAKMLNLRVPQTCANRSRQTFLSRTATDIGSMSSTATNCCGADSFRCKTNCCV